MRGLVKTDILPTLSRNHSHGDETDCTVARRIGAPSSPALRRGATYEQRGHVVGIFHLELRVEAQQRA